MALTHALRTAARRLPAAWVAGAPRVAPAAAQAVTQRRWLNVHECDSHKILQSFNIPVPRSGVATTPEEAREAARNLGCEEVVVKAQVLAGGRGKGQFDTGFQGGVHIVKNSDEAKDVAQQMLGHYLITKQTGTAGRICQKVMVVEKLNIVKEFYFAILMDRTAQGPVVVASSEGGMDIEKVAEENPDAIVKMAIDIEQGLTEAQAKEIAAKLKFPEASRDQAVATFRNLYKLFLERDATMVEINPMALDSFENVVCMDAKLNFDDNAEFRQRDVFALRDTSQENPLDVQASKFDLNYIGLDGNIGCLVNGAGLAMSTMDIIQMHGGKPANFLDVGGGATAKQVTEAFKLITSDPDVTAILVNIFGGIMRCDVIAEGIIKAASTLDLKVPVIVRLQGTRVSEAKALIAGSHLDILSADELDLAARKAVQVSRIVSLARNAGLHVKFQDMMQSKSDKSDDSAGLTPSFT